MKFGWFKTFRYTPTYNISHIKFVNDFDYGPKDSLASIVGCIKSSKNVLLWFALYLNKDENVH